MKSAYPHRVEVSKRPGGGAIRPIALILISTSLALAQTPASINTVGQLGAGHPVFDASGNTYYVSGPPPAGTTQTSTSGTACLSINGPSIQFVPCPPVSVTKNDPSGNQIWKAQLGGPTPQNGTALAVAPNGNVAFTGSTGGQFPTTPGVILPSSTIATAFAAVVSADGSKILYSTYLPPWMPTPTAIAMDAAGNAYVAGTTNGGHAFVLKLTADGSAIDYSVNIAGSGIDAATAITIDPAGNAIVAGQTTSPDFPVTAGAFQPRMNGKQNNFLVRLDPSGNVLTSTYLGGSGTDSPSSIAVDVAGNIDLAGFTSSLDFPGTSSPIVPAWNNFGPGGFVAQFAPDGLSFKWANYVMSTEPLPFGAGPDIGVTALAVDPNGDLYLSGLTGPGFPVTTSAPVICFQGISNRTDAFLAHLNSKGALLDATYLGNSLGGDVDFVGGLLPLPSGGALVAWNFGGDNVVSTVQFASGGWTPPACLSNNVLNAATQIGTSGIAPGELISLTGFGIGPETGVGSQPDAQGNLPTALAGVQVLFNGSPVPILYAQSRLINAIAPSGSAVNPGSPITIAYNNQQFQTTVPSLNVGNPGIFRLQIGQSSQAAAINQDRTINGPANPAPRGSIVSVWATGYGQTDPGCPTGGLNLPYAAPLAPGTSAQIASTIPEVAVPKPIVVTYAGSGPGLLCGMVQINFEVPADVPVGNYSFLPGIQSSNAGTIGQYQSQFGATIVVK